MTAEVAHSAEVQPSTPERKRFDILKVIVEKVTGTVKWFSVRRHYGFIQRDDNKEDVFVHRTAITASRSRFPTLKNGESVEFSVVETASGVNAASVTGPNGRQVQGVRFFRRPKPHVEVGEGQPKLNGTTQASGDVEGTRQRGGLRRMRRGRRPFRPSQNAMGDGENVGGEQGEELGGGLEGSRVLRQRPRRFRGGGRGRGRQHSTSTRQHMNGEDVVGVNGEEGGVLRQQQGGPRRGGGGRFRRGGGGGRMRRGGGAASARDGEENVNSASGEHAESLEKKVEDMTLETKTEASEKPKEVMTVEQQTNVDGDAIAEGATTKASSGSHVVCPSLQFFKLLSTRHRFCARVRGAGRGCCLSADCSLLRHHCAIPPRPPITPSPFIVVCRYI
ncbi:nuclease sensitive element binding protein [Echinococcus multilocularis]|uniref:Nuclease sensitive element binding protein n=1 Tax=Echinococcus multilocularis TaxID=6211 RepID=A0A068Y5S9_ECHMU|nr:nuclease sensitive element binding protein [Echinococcus multilocularis]